jgi:hypothetical protein
MEHLIINTDQNGTLKYFYLSKWNTLPIKMEHLADQNGTLNILIKKIN